MDKDKKDNRVPGVLIAAPSSGSGKTTFTTGLMAALKEKGHRVYGYKCGPDFIDPMYYTGVLGVPCRNLDTWFTGEEKTRELFMEGTGTGGIRIVEGVMGLYDGAAGTEREGSSYDLARTLGLPVILVVNARGMGRSAVALIKGFCDMDTGNLIKGIFLNNTAETLYRRLKPLIESETGCSCLGFLSRNEKLLLPERHLGLVTPAGREEAYAAFAAAAGESIGNALDWDKFYEISGYLSNMTASEEESILPEKEERPDSVLLAVARDEAFCFLYEDNLRELKKAGAELCFFSPIRDKRLPEGISGLLLYGGYPELYAEELSGNRELMEDIRRSVRAGLPTVAECGGFMYLQESIFTFEGKEYPMVGALPGISASKGHPVRFGYVEVREKEPAFLPEGTGLRGHEFHYYDSTENGDSCSLTKPVTGKSREGIVTTSTLWAGFPHIYYPAEPVFAETFVSKMREYSRQH